MNYSYDYSEFIKEIKEELEDGILTLSDNVQILRSKKAVHDKYYPIIDWYYSHDKEMELYKELEDLDDLSKLKQSYLNDRPNLKNITIADFLTEIEQQNKLFKV